MSRQSNPPPHATNELALTRKKRIAFYAIAIVAPFALLVLLEVLLRVSWPAGHFPLFQEVSIGGRPYLVASPRVGRRYFANEASPPTPPADVFAVVKPAAGLRIFVLGESSAAGFPYPPNGMFSRVVADALRDVLPNTPIEVINLGLAATNSYTLLDIVGEVIEQKPDAVLIYAGHNEYYGALGVGSSIGVGSSPPLVRTYLALQQLRTVVLMRNAINAVTRGSPRATATDSTIATFMESVAANQQIELGSAAFEAGMDQFHDNLTQTVNRLRSARIAVFIASIASNERSQAPFYSASNTRAQAAYDSGSKSFIAGDTVIAAQQFSHARDLDVIRFRAPSHFNATIRDVASATGAHYVPVAEAMRAVSPGGIPGSELFLEHVHPNQHGYAIIAREFFNALNQSGVLSGRLELGRLATWEEYERRMNLTSFDDRIVEHRVKTVVTRWPFVSREGALDYRGTYRATDYVDSLALLVSRGGISWGDAKLTLAKRYESSEQPSLALGEYFGLLRDRPLAPAPYILVSRSLIQLGRGSEAVPYLERAIAFGDLWEARFLLGGVALGQKDYAKAIALLDSAVTLAPNQAAPAYQLSRAFAASQNIEAARGAASRASQLDPGFPGLSEWMKFLGMSPR